MYNSFYGGRQGASFIIAKSFSSIAEMIENFKKGPDYQIVNYNEYVLINSATADNGKLYRRGYEYTNEMGGAIYVGQISGTSVTDVTIDTGDIEGEGSQKLMITYSISDEAKEIGNPINYIMRTAITNDYHLLILHSDPVKRAEIVAAGEGFTYDGRNDWQDLGSVKDENGIFIGLNYDVAEYPTLTNLASTLEFLNTEHPNGLTENLAGGVVTVGDSDESKAFYAFNYNLKADGSYYGWYYLGAIGNSDIGGSGAGVVVGREDDSTTISLANSLPENGVWFVVE